MRHHLHLAAALLLTVAETTHAQITPAGNMVSPPPRPPQVHSAHPAPDNLQWLWLFTQPTPSGNKPDLLADPRFTALLRDQLRAPQAMWGIGVSLSDAALKFLDGPGKVAATNNRYVTTTGCIPDDETKRCDQTGLLWADLGQPRPLLVFAALRWNEQNRTTDQANAPYTLWIFPARELDAHQLPEALKSALAAWAQKPGCVPFQITNAIVVDPSGVPHITGSLEAGVTPNVCTKSTGQTQ